MAFAPLPHAAAWHHHDARTGFEVVVFVGERSTITLRGTTAAVEDGTAWAVDYDIVLDPTWRTMTARVRSVSAHGTREVILDANGPGRWRINGSARRDLDGCLDVDLEASACTNTIPVHRLDLRVGEGAAAPAAYVRAVDVAVERLDQRYVRADAFEGSRQRFDYSAARFDYADQLVYDEAGLVLTYPGLATRAH